MKPTSQAVESVSGVKYISPNTCACGCGMAVQKKWHKGHNRRLVVHYRIDEPSGCWVWLGELNTGGYGTIRHMGKSVKAHRWVYVKHVGVIPDGMELDHLCRNRACVNPEHLEPVTRTENIRRGLLTKLTIENVDEIFKSSESRKVLAARFGVTKAAIGQIKRGEAWVDRTRKVA